MGIVKTDSSFVISAYSVAGCLEAKGPLGAAIDFTDRKDDTFGKDSWEMAESEMQRRASLGALGAADLSPDDVGVVFSGDLINQCIASTHGLMSLGIPDLGLFGACSTCAESMLLASVFSSYVKNTVLAVTSSHNCSAERQFRFPVEYAALRTPTSQWTVTGSAAFVISSSPRESSPRIAEGLVGRIVDSTLDDLNNMGGAMAPAAADTLVRYFRESGKRPSDFDAIVTGDLGAEGSSLLCEIISGEGYDIAERHFDCGLDIYDIKAQDMHSGGSGCGCSAVVMAAKYIPMLRSGEINDMLFVGTGALMNAMSVGQGNTIPAIAHLVRLTSGVV
ncbi:MAG: stage V sporulation protein AD [Clostridia bacterium]|nr:stage V sporulation protein AD [Clostridia bacterium]